MADTRSRPAVVTAAKDMLIVSIIVVLCLGLGINIMYGQNDSVSYSDIQEVCYRNACQTEKYHTLSVEGTYRYGAVASDAGHCSTVGTDIMAVGGSAVDVAIATMLCVCTFNLHNCGIGGGHFMTIYKREEKKAYVVMGREMAPGAATPDMFIGRSAQDGGLTIAIPGVIKGYWEAHQLAGTLPWKQLFVPTIKLCKEGFQVGKSLGYHINDKSYYFNKFRNFREMLTNATTGKHYAEGDILRLPKLVRTLEVIAEEGSDAFYNGSLTDDIIADIAEAGGIVTRDDLYRYTAAVKDPVVIQTHDGLRLMTSPPPSGGAVYAFVIGILDGYKFDRSSISSEEKRAETWHRIIEAFKFAYARRTEIGDSDVEGREFAKQLDELISNMTSPEYASRIRSQIDDTKTHGVQYYGPTFHSDHDSGTSHLSVLSPNGDAVSISSSIDVFFGSKVVGSRTGILFNDQMDDFSTPNTTNFHGLHASPANFIKPYKRPLSSMCPSVVVDKNGEVRLVIGASGGAKITTATALVTMETLWFGMSTKQAVDHSRIHHQLMPNEISIEKGFSEDIISCLRRKGHKIVKSDESTSIVQVVLRTPGKGITATSDFRKQGRPDGF